MEYGGEVTESMSREQRMTICNMSIEAGAKAGIIAPDEKAFCYLKDRTCVPKDDDWHQAMAYWLTLNSDVDAVFDQDVNIDAKHIAPQVTWGTTSGQVCAVSQPIPHPDKETDPVV